MALQLPMFGSNGQHCLLGSVVPTGVDHEAAAFVQALPPVIRPDIIRGFDGSTSKDGNVWGRLLGFIRFKWQRTLGLDQECANIVKSLPERAQMICLTEFDPSGTKDGNVAGRLQGFVKRVLARTGEAQPQRMAAVAPPIGFGGGGRPIARVGGPPARIGGAPARVGVQPARVGGDGGDSQRDADIQNFLLRCGLDETAAPLLEELSEEGLHKVLTNFDPSGTKDGNVLGRLEGYVRHAKRGSGQPAQRIEICRRHLRQLLMVFKLL